MTDSPDIEGIPKPEGPSDLIETDYEIGQDNIESKVGPFPIDIHNPVFMISGMTVVLFVIYALALPDQAASAFEVMKSFVITTFDWFFLSAANIIVIFCLLLIVTPYGSVRLGGIDARPDYSYIGWFAMLFAAGMGIGLLFFGVSEPMTHFSTALGGTSAEGGARTSTGRHWVRLRVTLRQPSVWACRQRSCIGACTRGRSMRRSRWPWRCSLTTRACR